MNIEQEDFDKLNQLDRIEFRQVEEEIQKEYKSNNTMTFIILALLVLFPILFSLVIIKELNYELFISFADKMKTLIILGYVCLFLSLASDLYLSWKKRKLINELESKYFKHELEKRR